MEVESSVGSRENRSPMAKVGRMEEGDGPQPLKGPKPLAKRQPLASVSNAPAAAPEAPLKLAEPAFKVFADAPAEGGERRRSHKAEPAVLKERPPPSRPPVEQDSTEELLTGMTQPVTFHLGAEDSGVGPGSVGAEDMSLCDESREEDEDSSAYASVVSEACSSSYYTAPLASAKELHREQVTACPAFADDIFRYLLAKETSPKLRISRNYMAKQTELNEAMRRTLVDWMVEVGMEYNLEQQTLHLAVRYVDRFLSLMDIPRHKLQLIGTTAVMVAAKLEEIYPPDLKEYVFITDDTYSEAQVRRMERIMLEHLDFQLYAPTMVLFAARYVATAKPPNATAALTHYLTDLSLLSLELSALRPSLVAAAAFALACLMTDVLPAWPPALQRLAHLSPAQVLPLVHKVIRLAESVRSAGKEHAVRDKYLEPKHHAVAKLTLPDPLSLHLL